MQTLSKSEIYRLKEEGRIVERPKKEVAPKVKAVGLKPVDTTALEAALSNAINISDISSSTLKNITKSDKQMDKLIQILSEKNEPSNCTLHINRGSNGLIKTIEIIRR